MRCSTASRLSALPVLVENSGSPGAPARSVSQDFRIETVRGSSEERLQGRREGGHGCPPEWVFRWAAASSINSGAALRYQ